MLATLTLRRAHRDTLDKLLLGKQEDNQDRQRRERRRRRQTRRVGTLSARECLQADLDRTERVRAGHEIGPEKGIPTGDKDLQGHNGQRGPRQWSSHAAQEAEARTPIELGRLPQRWRKREKELAQQEDARDTDAKGNNLRLVRIDPAKRRDDQIAWDERRLARDHNQRQNGEEERVTPRKPHCAEGIAREQRCTYRQSDRTGSDKNAVRKIVQPGSKVPGAGVVLPLPVRQRVRNDIERVVVR